MNCYLDMAPIIYARTKNIDFRWEYLVKPNDFDDRLTTWSRQYVLASTRFIESIRGSWREIVFSNGKVGIVGIAIEIETLFKLCVEIPDKDLLKDNFGRSVVCFIGFAFKAKGNILSGIQIPFEIYLESYKKIMSERWNEFTDKGTTLSDYVKVKVNEVVIKENRVFNDYDNNVSILDNSFNEKNELSQYILYMALNGKTVAYCSNMSDVKSIYESPFKIATMKNAEVALAAYIREKNDRNANTTNNINKAPYAENIRYNIERKQHSQFEQSKKGKNQSEGILDFVLGAATIVGITIIIISEFEPIVKIIIGAITFIIGGSEAARIIKGCKNSNSKNEVSTKSKSKGRYDL